MFENKVYEGIHYSRFVASWLKSFKAKEGLFKEWLKSLKINGKPIPDDVIKEIVDLGFNGKLELEEHIKLFLKENGA